MLATVKFNMELNQLKEHFYFCNDHFGTEIEHAAGFFDKRSFFRDINVTEHNVHKRTGYSNHVGA